MKTHEKYLNEVGLNPHTDDRIDYRGGMEMKMGKKKKPYPKDLNIKDTALALTGEIESMISKLINDWFAHDEFANMRTADIKKAVNLAIKNINLRNIM